MQALLRRKLLRDMRQAWPRYLALGLMIALSLYLIISLLGAGAVAMDGMEQRKKGKKV